MNSKFVNNLDFESLKLDLELATKFPKEIAEKYNILIIGVEDGVLKIISDKANYFYKDIVQMYFDYPIEILIGPLNLIRDKIRNIYFIEDNKNLFLDKEEVKDSEIVEIINNIVNKAIYLGASDIHFEPYEEEIRIRYRINGELKFVLNLNKIYYNNLIARLKIISGLDISERRLPQDGRIKLNLSSGNIDIRVSIIPNIFGEKIVFRILDKNKSDFSLSSLGLDKSELSLMENIIRQPYGMVLITGPAGSGKTTTLYTILKELNHMSKNIITIEDPIEYTIHGINQSQVNEKINYSFNSGLKSILRQDPDIIMIGEIRDEELAKLALRSGILGHLIFSTLHTNNSIATIFRLLSMNIEDYLIASGLIAIISQRLVRNLCNKCKISRPIEKNEKKLLKINENIEIFDALGCNFCIDGYSGRRPIMEILKVDDEVRNLIQNSKDIVKFRQTLSGKNISTLFNRAKDLVIAGETSMEEFIKVNMTL